MSTLKKLVLAVIFTFAFFVPRYFAHLRYDALEDEILAIRNNIWFSPLEFIRAPDYTHPGFWYILMELPTKILGLSHGIFYYRLLQTLILFFFIVLALFYFKKKLSKTFLSIFFILFLANIYLAHLTVQHRMYALVLGISIVYSFYWIFLLKRPTLLSVKESISLALFAALGFFTNYSIIWLLPIWPLTYFLQRISISVVKKLTLFAMVLFGAVSWFVPIFLKNTAASIAINQWALSLTSRNVTQLFGNYFGIVSKNLYMTEEVNWIVFPFLCIFLILVTWAIFIKKNPYIKYLFFSLCLALSFFILAVHQTGNSILYARTTVPIIVVFYVLIAEIFVLGNKYIKAAVIILIAMQLSQFLLYFSPNEKFEKEYHLFDYRENTLGHFKTYTFPPESCLISVPEWNEFSAQFFLGNSVQIISTDHIDPEDIYKEIETCPIVYVLDQTSVDRGVIYNYYLKVFGNIPKMQLIAEYENQALFVYK